LAKLEKRIGEAPAMRTQIQCEPPSVDPDQCQRVGFHRRAVKHEPS
jgi:hypothetical protein